MDHNSPTKTIPVQFMRCVQRRVSSVRKELTKQHVDGFELSDTFGSLTSFCEENLFSTLLLKHNDAEDPYHLCLFDFVVLGSQVTAKHDLVRNAHYLWFRLDALQRPPRHHSRVGISIEWRRHR